MFFAQKVVRARIFSACVLLPLWCAAVRPYTPTHADPLLEPWRWRDEEAVAGLGALCMDEAEDGSLWFGNVGSLAHYDGLDLTIVPFDEQLLSKISLQKETPLVKALQVLSNGTLLTLIGKSVVLYAEGSWQIIIQDVGASGNSSKFLRTANGAVWLVVQDGVWRISQDLAAVEQIMKAPAKNEFFSGCMDPSGDLWVLERTPSDRSTLIHLPMVRDRSPEKTEWQRYPIPFPDDGQHAQIATGEEGMILYINSSKVGLQRFNSRTKQWAERSGEHESISLYSVLNLSDGSIVAGARDGIMHYRHEETPTFFLYDQLGLPRVQHSLFETKAGRLWLIGRVGYVHSIDLSRDEWDSFLGLHFQSETESGIQWFISYASKQIVSYDSHSGEWLKYEPRDHLTERVTTLFCSSHGLVWAAGIENDRAAISVFDGSKWTRIQHPEFAKWIRQNAVFEAQDGSVWFGAGGGPLAGAGGALQFGVSPAGLVELIMHHKPPDFPYHVTSFEQTPDGLIWLGSISDYRYDGRSKISSRVTELPDGQTVAMTLGGNQTLWLAKENAGVYRLLPEGWELFTMEDGLAGLKMVDLLTLKDGSILAASEQGISRFDGVSWTGQAYTEAFSMKTRWSGMKQSADGALWLNYGVNDRQFELAPEMKGFCTLRHRMETDPPATEVDYYLSHVSPPGNTHISWSAKDVWSHTPHEKLQYSWRLNNGEWSTFSEDSERTFLNLAPGKHQLEVRSRDLAFNIDPTPVLAEFEVIPPVWRQAWFIILMSGLTGSILLLNWKLIRTREQQLLQQKNHLVEMDRIKTGFFTNISHELRTPMTVISGRLESMIKGESDPDKKDTLSILMRNAGRISTLISQLLDFRKLEAGKLAIEATQGDLIPSLRDWVAALKPLADDAQTSYTLECPNECRGTFDFDKVEKIVTNLISNSIKYTDSGGSIFVGLDLSEVDPARRMLKLVVEDNGVGITPEHVLHIFDRFYRVSESSTAAGAGIGLNLTRELVELLGGTIHVESPVHSDPKHPGARFTVLLPIHQDLLPDAIISHCEIAAEGADSICKDELDAKKRPDERGLLASGREKPPDSDAPALVLIVEDDADIRSFVVEGLELAYQVITAENGAVGLQMAKEQVPDLVVTDLMMPEMDGTTLCQHLKTSVETSHIPVVMLTAKASLEHQLEGLKTGADDYITKPFHMELLQVRIANLLESRRKLREAFFAAHPMLTSNVPENAPDKEFLEKVMQVLDAHYSDFEFNLDQFADALNMSRSTLKRKLKCVADRTPADLLNEFRMMRAAELLAGSSENIAEIGFMVGCDEPANFSRLFKKYYQTSPSKYRSDHRS